MRCWLSSDDLQGKLFSDGELTLADLTSIETAKLLKEGGPWGQGFPEPLFDGIFEVVWCNEAKSQTLQLRLRLPGTNSTLKAVKFEAGKDILQGQTTVQIAYHLDVNIWNGREEPQLRIEHIEPIGF